MQSAQAAHSSEKGMALRPARVELQKTYTSMMRTPICSRAVEAAANDNRGVLARPMTSSRLKLLAE